MQGGSAEGIMIGGNLCSLNLLNGTEYFPKIEGDIILCIEDDSYDSIPETVERNIQSLMHQPFFRQVKAILVGRFQGESRATDDMISDIILSKNIDPKFQWWLILILVTLIRSSRIRLAVNVRL